MALKTDANFEGKLTCVFKNDMRNLENIHKLKNSDFILESIMAELNQNKNSKQPISTRCSVKPLFYLRNNE